MIDTLLSPLANLALDTLNVPNVPLRITPTFLPSPSVLASAVIAGSPKTLLGTVSFTLVIVYTLRSQYAGSRSQSSWYSRFRLKRGQRLPYGRFLSLFVYDFVRGRDGRDTQGRSSDKLGFKPQGSWCNRPEHSAVKHWYILYV